MKSQNLTLRDAEPSDAAARFQIGRDPEITRLFGVSRKDVMPLTHEECADWVKGVQDSDWAWVIDVNGPIGSCRLHSYDATTKSATFAIAIFSNAHLGQGIGTIATNLVLAYGFDELSLKLIRLRVLAFNPRAIACYKKCGFEEVAREPKGEFVDGEWVADIFMELSQATFQKRKAASLQA
nr:GNAT family protein [Maritalea mediterranea]